MFGKVIAAKEVSDETQEWLKAHGAAIYADFLKWGDPLIIVLPENARVEQGSQQWEYTIHFYNKAGNSEPTYAYIELNIDANETTIELQNDGSEDE